MTRKEIEEYIVNGLSKYLEQNNFKLKNKSFKREHYARYDFRKDEVLYKWSISFLKYGNINVSLLVYYDSISERYNQLSHELNGGSNFVFAFRMNAYLHPQNADGYFNTSDSLEFPYKEDVSEGKNLVNVIDSIYQTYFVNCVPKIISQTDSLEKANELINKIPFDLDEEGDPKMLVYSTSLVVQMLNGILIAQECKNPNYNLLKNIYLECCDRIDNRTNIPIALIREAIEDFEKNI